MQIYGPSRVDGPQGLQGPHTSRAAGQRASQAPVSPADQLDISPEAQAAAQAAESGEVRADLVARVRTEIAAGTYETPEKLNAAFDRLLDELG